MAATMPAVSQSPCCWSSTTAVSPSRTIVSATIADDRKHQEENTVSPARNRRARAKAGTSAALLDLRERDLEQFAHFRADLLFGEAFALQILHEFTQNFGIAGLLEFGEHDVL